MLIFGGKRKTVIIPYELIDTLEIYFNNKGYNLDTKEGLNYRRRQTHVGREAFNLVVTSKDAVRYELSLDRLFYADSNEYHYFLATMMYFKKHDIKILDAYGIFGCIRA
uniref:Uncharacterized protein n=1 Tax=Erysipelothrix tonsillarum TaxID=38402 RepID=A0A6S6I6R9_9FIRM|nr:hypothetical protein [Erysipelothrix tonsillarum]